MQFAVVPRQELPALGHLAAAAAALLRFCSRGPRAGLAGLTWLARSLARHLSHHLLQRCCRIRHLHRYRLLRLLGPSRVAAGQTATIRGADSPAPLPPSLLPP